MAEEVNERDIDEIANAVGKSHNADVIFYNGGINRPCDQTIIDACIRRRRHENVLFILITSGGDADAAYRIAKCLQSKYEKFILYVPGYCKSAGTLIVLGANELIFSDHGELGPLDVQMSKEDDLFQLQSGFTVMDALTALQDKAFLSFENAFLEIEKRSEGAITVKTAGEIATNLATGLFSNLFGQVDPLHVGESMRALSIAEAYGRRLQLYSGNWGDHTLQTLLSGYPSHGFVIDREEAVGLFTHIREPIGDEILLAEKLADNARRPRSHLKEATIKFMNEEKQKEQPSVRAVQRSTDNEANSPS